MDKKILSAAIIAALAAPVAALADTSLYGQVDLSVNAVDRDLAAGSGVNGDDINMNSNNSRIGIKGSEDLGGGLSAIYQLEYQVDPSGNDTTAGGTSTFSSRDQWIGLGGGFGKLRLGTMSTMYKSTGSSIDPLWDSALDTRNTGMQSSLHSGDGSNGEGRATNTVGFDTADYSGFSAGATYSFDDACSVGTATTPACQDDDSYSLGGKYSNGPILAFADYVTSDQGDSDDAWKLGGSYNFGDATVFGQYEFDGGLISQTSSGIGAGNTEEDADVWMLGGSYALGSITLVGQYAQGADSNVATTNTEYNSWSLAGMYGFSKRTWAYAGFNQISCDSNAGAVCGNLAGLGASGGENDTFGVGLRHKF